MLNKITRKEFEKFESVRRKGIFNIIEKISAVTGLTREQIGEIIKNYPKYSNKLKEELGYETK